MLFKVSSNSKFHNQVLFYFNDNFYEPLKLFPKLRKYERKQNKNCLLSYPKYVKQSQGRDCIWDVIGAQ